MKNKASLALMEQLVMLLVFALSAAICLSLFARAHGISEETARRDEAVRIAQSAAARIKASGSPACLLEETGAFVLTLQTADSGIPGFGQGKIIVLYEGEEIYSLPIGWQEVAP